MTLDEFAKYLNANYEPETGMVAELLDTVEAVVASGVPIVTAINASVGEMIGTLAEIRVWVNREGDK